MMKETTVVGSKFLIRIGDKESGKYTRVEEREILDCFDTLGFTFVIHKPYPVKEVFVVSEYSTGMLVDDRHFETAIEAKLKVDGVLRAKGEEVIREKIKQHGYINIAI